MRLSSCIALFELTTSYDTRCCEPSGTGRNLTELPALDFLDCYPHSATMVVILQLLLLFSPSVCHRSLGSDC
jgi:hypothetical protein